MPTPSDWFELQLLDQVDITAGAVRQATQVQAALPGLRAALADAGKWVADALAPVPPNHPADDTWDDQIWFVRALNESAYGSKAAAVQAAEQELDALEKAEDPGRRVAGFVLTRVHMHLKEAGFDGAVARKSSQPDGVPGLPLAELIWQARNQDQHYLDARDLHDACVDAFDVLVKHSPGTFELSQPPSTRRELRDLLKDRSWAPEVLVLLGWTSSAAAVVAIKSIS